MALDDDIRGAAVAGRATAWNERVLLSFMSAGRVDPERAATQAWAVIRSRMESQHNATGGGAQAWTMRISSAETEARIDRTTYDGPVIRVDDRLKRTERDGQWYAIASVNDRDAFDYILTLTEV